MLPTRGRHAGVERHHPCLLAVVTRTSGTGIQCPTQCLPPEGLTRRIARTSTGAKSEWLPNSVIPNPVVTCRATRQPPTGRLDSWFQDASIPTSMKQQLPWPRRATCNWINKIDHKQRNKETSIMVIHPHSYSPVPFLLSGSSPRNLPERSFLLSRNHDCGVGLCLW